MFIKQWEDLSREGIEGDKFKTMLASEAEYVSKHALIIFCSKTQKVKQLG
jgi:hypothetical protein